MKQIGSKEKVPKGGSLTRFAWVLIPFLLAIPAGGVTNIISPGDTVFIGEEGLDVSAALPGTANQIAWFSPGSNPQTDVPAMVLTVGDRHALYLAPAQFRHATGTWYAYNRSVLAPAFQVQYPALLLRIRNQETGEDVTGMGAAPGTLLNFRIETNMNAIARREGYDPVTDGYLSIILMTPARVTLTALEGPGGNATPLGDLNVDTSVWYWVPPGSGSGWDTGAATQGGTRLYPPGTYTARLDYNVNHLQDNLQGVAGFLPPSPVQVTLGSDRVSTGSSRTEVVRGDPFTVTITGVPGGSYYVWVRNTGTMSGEPGNQPPLLTPAQEGVRTDPAGGPYSIGSYQYSAGQGETIRDDVPPAPTDGTRYYALVTLPPGGTRAVQWQTSTATDDRRYTFRVERVVNGRVSSDDVTVGVVRGSVSIGTGTSRFFYLGEQITLSGTNTETDTTYLFMTGPNLPGSGGSLTSPRSPVRSGQPGSFTSVDVDPDRTWEYRWFTGNLGIDAGSYTVYVVSEPRSRSDLSGVRFATIPISFVRPFVTAGVSQGTIARGDPVRIQGSATGNPSPGVAIWTFGVNRFLYDTEEINADGSFTYELNEAETADLATGQYYTLVQHPGYTNTLDVYPDPGRQLVLSLYPNPGSVLFRVSGPGALMSTQAADALIRALDSPFVDDTYLALSFVLANPQVTISPPGNYTAGERITLSGSTNLAPGNQLLMEVTSESFGPTPKEGGGAFSGTSGTTLVRAGTGGRNNWSFSFETSGFAPDTYVVVVSGVTVPGASATTRFSLAAVTPTPTLTTPPTTAPTTIPTTTPPSTPTTTAGLSWIPLAGGLALALVMVGLGGRRGGGTS